jgi:hypothetical protein
MITNQPDLRAAFWEAHPQLTRKGRMTQNHYPADTRLAWCDFVDAMQRNGEISKALASRVTL